MRGLLPRIVAAIYLTAWIQYTFRQNKSLVRGLTHLTKFYSTLYVQHTQYTHVINIDT